jgi:hypothetical protein
LSAYHWLVDISVLKLLDTPNLATIAEAFSASNFLALFKVAKFFGVVVTSPRSARLQETVSAVIQSLQEKLILPVSVNVSQLIQKDKIEIAKVIVSLHETALNRKKASEASLQELSDWLLSLGLIPSNGEEWFGRKQTFSFTEEKLRNGDLFRSLCIVFRPEIFEGILPPVNVTQEMIERNRQSLTILADEGVISKYQINLAEKIVQGIPEVIEEILRNVKESWEERRRIASERIERKLNLIE